MVAERAYLRTAGKLCAETVPVIDGLREVLVDAYQRFLRKKSIIPRPSRISWELSPVMPSSSVNE